MRSPAPAGIASAVPQPQPAPPEPASAPESTPAGQATPEVVAGATEASVGAASAAVAAAAAAPAPQAPEGAPPPGDPDPEDTTPAQPPAWRLRRHRRLPTLRIGRHVADDEALDRLQLSAASPGLRLGRDQAGDPVALPLFRPEPTRVVLIGPSATAALLALRALRLGCRLMVFTHDTGGWIALGRRATGRTDRVAVLAPGSAVNRVSSADAPVLRMLLPDPATGTPPSPDPDLPGWSTELSASPRLTPALADRLAAADLVLAHRLPPTEAAGLCAARRLAGPVAHLLQVLHDDMLAVLSPAGQRYAWIGPTRLEADILAEPPAGTPSR